MRTGKGAAVWRVVIALVVLAFGVKVALTVDWGRWPELSTLTVESALDSSVLVDVRMRARSGAVDGPITQRLDPGSELTFTAPPDRPVCVRLFVPHDRRFISFQVDGGRQASSTAVRLLPSTLQRTPSGFARCDPELAQHRVRTTLGRYFHPDQPETLRRERILSRSRL